MDPSVPSVRRTHPMRFRATSFAILLALSLLLEAVGHDVLCAHEDQALPHAAAQGASAEDRAPSLGPDILPGHPHHEHECPYCLRGGQRISLGPTPTSGHPLRIAQGSRVPDSCQPTRQLPASRTSRGPPAS